MIIRVFIHRRCMYWIVYLTSWILGSISLLNSGLSLIWCIVFSTIGIESLKPLGIDKIHRVYIGNKRWFFGGVNVGHWGRYGLEQEIPCKNLIIIHNYLIFLLLSFFGSISLYLKFNRVDIELYWWDYLGGF